MNHTRDVEIHQSSAYAQRKNFNSWAHFLHLWRWKTYFKLMLQLCNYVLHWNPFIISPFIKTQKEKKERKKSYTISQARKTKIWMIWGSNVMAFGGGFVKRFRWEWGKKLRAGTKGSYLNTKDSIPEIPTKHKTRTMMPFWIWCIGPERQGTL